MTITGAYNAAALGCIVQAWCQSIAEGRNYASDGYSHLLDFTVDDVRMGENGSELQIPAGGKTVIVNVSACAMLGEVCVVATSMLGLHINCIVQRVVTRRHAYILCSTAR